MRNNEAPFMSLNSNEELSMHLAVCYWMKSVGLACAQCLLNDLLCLEVYLICGDLIFFWR